MIASFFHAQERFDAIDRLIIIGRSGVIIASIVMARVAMSQRWLVIIISQVNSVN